MRPAGRTGRAGHNRLGCRAAARNQLAGRLDPGAARTGPAAGHIQPAVPVDTREAGVPAGIRAEVPGSRAAVADSRVEVLAGTPEAVPDSRVEVPAGTRVVGLGAGIAGWAGFDRKAPDIRAEVLVPATLDPLCGSLAAGSRVVAAVLQRESCPNQAATGARFLPVRPEGRTLREGIGTLRTSWLMTDILRIRRCGQQHQERYPALATAGRRTRSQCR